MILHHEVTQHRCKSLVRALSGSPGLVSERRRSIATSGFCHCLQEVEVEDLPDDFEEHATLHHRHNAGDGSEPLLA